MPFNNFPHDSQSTNFNNSVLPHKLKRLRRLNSRCFVHSGDSDRLSLLVREPNKSGHKTTTHPPTTPSPHHYAVNNPRSLMRRLTTGACSLSNYQQGHNRKYTFKPLLLLIIPQPRSIDSIEPSFDKHRLSFSFPYHVSPFTLLATHKTCPPLYPNNHQQQ